MTDLLLTHEPPPEAAAETAYPESTLSLRLDVDGIGISWTLRGSDESMSKRLPRVLDYIRRLQDRLPTAGESLVLRPSSLAQDKGHRTNDPAKPLEERDDWCPIHHKPLVTQKNARGEWKSHRTADGEWCKGKSHRAGERAS